jgi:hypothetical protein
MCEVILNKNSKCKSKTATAKYLTKPKTARQAKKAGHSKIIKKSKNFSRLGRFFPSLCKLFWLWQEKFCSARRGRLQDCMVQGLDRYFSGDWVR